MVLFGGTYDNLDLYGGNSPFSQQLSLLKWNELYKFYMLTTFHSILSNKTPSYLSDSFSCVSEISA